MTYFEFAALRLLWTELNVDCKLVRKPCKAVMMLMLTMAAINAYSMAVAPDSSFTKRENFVIGVTP